MVSFFFVSSRLLGSKEVARVNVKPVVVLSPDQYMDVKEIAPGMEFTQRWGANWRLALQGNLHQIRESDYVRCWRE